MKADFSIMKNDILGKKYSLSIARVDEKISKEINNKYRNKNRPTNILSFPLRKNKGEILLCETVIKREAKKFGKTPSQFTNFLVIHGMLHLKGFGHGKKMEGLENSYCKKFKTNL